MPIIDIQALLDGIGMKHAEERSASDQWTLGQMMKALERLPVSAPVEGIGRLESYRGYYSDLSFEIDRATSRTVGDVLADCRAALGECFTGYKGGDFWMTKNTPLWNSEYGRASGLKVMGLDTKDGVLFLVTKQEDE